MATPADPAPKAFVDTNILVYAFDRDGSTKHLRSLELVSKLLLDDRLVLSVQVLNEFFWNATNARRAHPLTVSQATGHVAEFIETAHIEPLTPETTLEALRAVKSLGLSFWDGLIWAAAKLAGCSLIYSEDFQSGQELEGVRIVNPLI